MKGVEPIIAAILIIMISIAGIIIVLEASQGSVGKLTEIGLFEEAKKILTSIDDAVRSVSQEGEGSSRILHLSVSGGKYYIDVDSDIVNFSMESRSQIVGIGVAKTEGYINVLGEEGRVLLSVSYTNVNITGGGSFGKGYRNLAIRNEGYDVANQKQMVSIQLS